MLGWEQGQPHALSLLGLLFLSTFGSHLSCTCPSRPQGFQIVLCCSLGKWSEGAPYLSKPQFP